MEVKTKQLGSGHLSDTLDAAAMNAMYNTQAKEILADKQIFARIVKYSLEEFADVDIESIIEAMDEPVVSRVRVEPGMTNTSQAQMSPAKIMKLSEEDDVIGEGKIVYDVRTNLYHGKMKLRFLLNLEAQKSSDPAKLGYQIDNRMLYYMSRMVSAQKETEFSGTDYDEIKPIRSIWICMDAGEDTEGITKIELVSRTMVGNEVTLENLNKFQGVIIRIRKEREAESENYLIGMLEELFGNTQVSEKKKNLKEKYGITMSHAMEGRVNTMCNWGEMIEECGIEKGLQQGLSQGLQQGISQGLQQGLSQGLLQGRTASILELLNEYGTVPENIENLITGTTDIDILSRWNKLAAKSETVEEFIAKM